MLEQLLAVFAVWTLWNLFVLLVTTPPWFPPVLGIALGVGFELFINPSYWWLGVGVGGAAGFMVLVGDLLLVTTDAVRRQLLLGMKRRG